MVTTTEEPDYCEGVIKYAADLRAQGRVVEAYIVLDGLAQEMDALFYGGP